jgi:hypothetical protein
MSKRSATGVLNGNWRNGWRDHDLESTGVSLSPRRILELEIETLHMVLRSIDDHDLEFKETISAQLTQKEIELEEMADGTEPNPIISGGEIYYPTPYDKSDAVEADMPF